MKCSDHSVKIQLWVSANYYSRGNEMAFTATLKKHAISGNERVAIYQVAADAASGMVVTPLSYVDAVTWAPISMATFGGTIKINTNDSSAVANGTVFISSVANGDDCLLY